MSDNLPWPEPTAGPWTVRSVDDVLERLSAVGTDRPRFVAVDGRGAGGKSTLAALLSAAIPSSAVVHIDDIAWNEPLFEWGPLLREHVLVPLHAGASLRYRPAAWLTHGREGAIVVPAGLDLVILEGVGAAQRSVADLIDAVVWVQSDFAQAESRGIARDIEQGVNGDPAQTVVFWHWWMEAELRFVADERPWERADLVVAGTPTTPPPAGHVVVAPGPLTSIGDNPLAQSR